MCNGTKICITTRENNNTSGLIIPQTSSNLISLTILVTLRPFPQFQPKAGAINLQKSATNFPDVVTVFPIFSLRSKFGIKKLSSLL